MYNVTGDVNADGLEALNERIGSRLGAIEEVTLFGKAYQNIRIGKVVSCIDHPNADRLHICLIDDDRQTPDVERNSDGFVQVVCGAPNVREGITVAWLPPGSVVPETYFKEPFTLERRAIRGEMSNGMLASARELALSDNHKGILELDADAPIGSDFADHYGLRGDVVINIENKMFTHRPDCFGTLGVYRELAGISGLQFKSPSWYNSRRTLPIVEGEALPLKVSNEIPELVPRFTAVALDNVTITASPVWLQIELAKVGIRSINNIVDYSNYFMILTGQPVHIYDYNKVKVLSGSQGAHLIVRYPKPGEKITLLNGKEIEPRSQAMMVATEKKLICLGGSMGGSDTEVDDQTTAIIIEAATWDMYEIRRTSMAHGIFTDAVTRFNKGQSPLQNTACLGLIVDQIVKEGHARIASNLVDLNYLSDAVKERQCLFEPIIITVDFINDRLGSRLSLEEVQTILTNTEFIVTKDTAEQMTVTAPFWRTDIEIREDVVEEVGRLYGYDLLALTLPDRSIVPADRNKLIDLRSMIRRTLIKAGLNELLTYTFVHGDLLKRVGQDPDRAFQVNNALSPELQYYRLSLVPSLLEKVHANVKSGFTEFGIYEMGKVHRKDAIDEDGLPYEFDRLGIVYASNSNKAGAAFYYTRTILDYLSNTIGLAVSIEPFQDASDDQDKPFDTQRSAHIFDKKSGILLGIIGELQSSVRKSLKLPEFTAAIELDLSAMAQCSARTISYQPLSKYPSVEQDICLKVKSDLSYQELTDYLSLQLQKLVSDNTVHQLIALDIYQRPNEPDFKQITYRLHIASYIKTLTDKEVNQLLDSLAVGAGKVFAATRI